MIKTIQIANKKVGEGQPTYIIAEMSANHMQQYDRARRIILAAKEAGADAIKLQSYRPDTITINCNGKDFMASKGSLWEGQNLFKLYNEAYMPWEWHSDLFDYAKQIGITIFSSPFDFSAVDLLEELDAPAYKIASLEILDIPLIKKVAKTGKPVIISTGIANISDINRALLTCQEEGNDNVVLLKCVSDYPTKYSDLNLKTIPNMSDTFNCIVGLSDHSMGSAVDIAAVTLGAKMIEKHLTLKREDGGPDGQFSMEPEEFAQMVKDIRNVEQAIGKCTYSLSERQQLSRLKGRSLYVVKDIKEGELFSADNIKSIRPGYGLPTWYYEEIIGKKASQNIKRGTALTWRMVSD